MTTTGMICPECKGRLAFMANPPRCIKCNVAMVDMPSAQDIFDLLRFFHSKLPDGDPHKITRDWIISLRDAADVLREDNAPDADLTAIADALEAYLFQVKRDDPAPQAPDETPAHAAPTVASPTGIHG